jgi:muramidase (phage lysozyme)
MHRAQQHKYISLRIAQCARRERLGKELRRGSLRESLRKVRNTIFILSYGEMDEEISTKTERLNKIS